MFLASNMSVYYRDVWSMIRMDQDGPLLSALEMILKCTSLFQVALGFMKRERWLTQDSYFYPEDC